MEEEKSQSSITMKNALRMRKLLRENAQLIQAIKAGISFRGVVSRDDNEKLSTWKAEINIDEIFEKIFAEAEEIAGITRDNLREAFDNGLYNTIKGYIRIGEKKPEVITQTKNQFIESYVLNLLRLIRRVKRKENYATAKQALRLIKILHMLPPNILDILKEKFPEIDESVIKHAALGYPSNPEAFIEKYLKEIERLKEKFPEIDESVIKHAALGYPSNPEAFIEKYLKEIERLKEKFPEIDESVIKHAASRNPSNPEAFIEKYLKGIERLKEKFPEIDASVIKYAALNYPSNPEAFIEKYLKGIERLKEKFPEIDASVIKYAALNYPSNPEAFIEKLLNITPKERKQRIEKICENRKRITPTDINKADHMLYLYYIAVYRYEGCVDWLAILLNEFPDKIQKIFHHRNPAQTGFGDRKDNFTTTNPEIDFSGLKTDFNPPTPEEKVIAAENLREAKQREKALQEAIQKLPPDLQDAISDYYKEKRDENDSLVVAAIEALKKY